MMSRKVTTFYGIAAFLLLMSAASAQTSSLSPNVEMGTTGSIGGGALAAGACASGPPAVATAVTTATVEVSPNTYPGDGNFYFGYVSAPGTVTVKVCSVIAATPTASTYNVHVR